jgi:uncharacterized protein YdhG (YjbR/CyaY superfamily)
LRHQPRSKASKKRRQQLSEIAGIRIENPHSTESLKLHQPMFNVQQQMLFPGVIDLKTE